MPNPVKIPATVAHIENRGDGIYSVVFQPQRRLPRFDAGQFLHLAIDDYDPRGGFWPESRVFSIASSRRDTSIAINYSVKGHFTRRMAAELAVGKPVWLKLPYGEFVINRFAGSREVILLAGGTGISPYLSYLSDLLQEATAKRVHLVYGVRKREHILQADLLNRCISEIEGFSLDLFIEEEAGAEPPLPAETVHPGMIDTGLLKALGHRYPDPLYFISGPPAMIGFFRDFLRGEGVSDASIRIDEWE